jgi:hypothetical protein
LDQQKRQIVARIELNMQPGRFRLVVPLVLALTGQRWLPNQPLGILVVQNLAKRVVHRRQTRRETLAQRPAERALNPELTVLGPSQVHVTFELARRLLGDVLDEPTGGIAAEERALRALGHLHALGVEGREVLPLRHRDVGIIDVHRHRRLHPVAEIVLRDAANRKQRGLPADAAPQIHPRRHPRQVRAARETERAHLIAAQRADRNPHVLNALLALLRGDHNLLEHSARVLRGRHRRPQRRRHGEARHAGREIRSRGSLFDSGPLDGVSHESTP